MSLYEHVTVREMVLGEDPPPSVGLDQGGKRNRSSDVGVGSRKKSRRKSRQSTGGGERRTTGGHRPGAWTPPGPSYPKSPLAGKRTKGAGGGRGRRDLRKALHRPRHDCTLGTVAKGKGGKASRRRIRGRLRQMVRATGKVMKWQAGIRTCPTGIKSRRRCSEKRVIGPAINRGSGFEGLLHLLGGSRGPLGIRGRLVWKQHGKRIGSFYFNKGGHYRKILHGKKSSGRVGGD